MWPLNNFSFLGFSFLICKMKGYGPRILLFWDAHFSQQLQKDRMSRVFDMVPSAAWGFPDFLRSFLLPQQVVAILRCDAMISSSPKGCFQQTCTPNTGQDPKAPTICQYQLSMFPHNKVKALSGGGKPNSISSLSHFSFRFLMKLREIKGWKTQHSSLFSRSTLKAE